MMSKGKIANYMLILLGVAVIVSTVLLLIDRTTFGGTKFVFQNADEVNVLLEEAKVPNNILDDLSDVEKDFIYGKLNKTGAEYLGVSSSESNDMTLSVIGFKSKDETGADGYKYHVFPRVKLDKSQKCDGNVLYADVLDGNYIHGNRPESVLFASVGAHEYVFDRRSPNELGSDIAKFTNYSDAKHKFSTIAYFTVIRNNMSDVYGLTISYSVNGGGTIAYEYKAD